MRQCKRLAVACGAIGLFAGCAMSNPFIAPPDVSGKPLVWNCAMVQMSSPPRYACPDGKTYTAFQLRDFREDSSRPADGAVASK
ncbi:MAG TPA: hypothetical protein VJ718_07050 [Candidatus Binataceae bacterium]|nr:hypothetical protein [Candidatus Binataceae bacterium]